MNRLIFMLLLAGLGLGGCSHPDPKEERSEHVYLHTRELMWEQLLSEANERWRVERSDPVLGEIDTRWDVQTHPLNTFGERHRLLLKLEEAEDGAGYRVLASQESEMNTNQTDPLSEGEADWDPVESDGVLARVFLIQFHARMNPATPWRDDEVR